MLTYKEAMNYIQETMQYGSVLGLENTMELLRRLENPEKKLKFIHIAGTNGKGSIAAYISSMLAEANYCVGRYVSPTIFDYCERIQIQTKEKTEYISKESVADILTKIKFITMQMTKEGYPHPTAFEIETAMAFLEFVNQGCDYVVLEVGMGGRLDSTNVIKNTICAVFSSISMDHMEFLGNSLEKIAYEKAGIIKQGCQVISYDQNWESNYPKRELYLDGGMDAMTVIQDECIKQKASLTIADFSKIKNVSHSFDGIYLDYKDYNHVKISLLGECQPKNAAVAIEVIETLGLCTKEQIYSGLEKTAWRGRFDILSKDPLIIVDGAHNEGAARSLEQSILYYLKEKRLIYVIGMLADKDYSTVLEYTAKYAQRIVTITPNSIRALSSGKLMLEAKKYCNDVVDGHTIEEGLELAEQYRKKENFDGILIFGSLSFLGEVYQYYNIGKE